MPGLTTEVRVFVSSTFLDLKDLRAEVSRRLREIFGAQLITMETFGSDDAEPRISSVRRVRECDVFVGIYARRYGTVDAESGKSITELELEEAERAHSAGNIRTILLYVLNDQAAWPSEYVDAEPAAADKLRRLKERAQQHTVTRFSASVDLPFLIIRDVLAKIRQRLGEMASRPRNLSLPDERRLTQPIGMEFLTSADRRHLCGRENTIAELLASITKNPITLLLGNSGTGKTSVVHAGVFPVAFMQGWLPVYTRPLGLPRTDVATGIEGAVFDGPTSYRGSLVPLLKQVTATVSPKKVMLVIDQFEDILTAKRAEEAEQLVEDLRVLRYLDDPDIRVLVCYRADLEARLGEFWQLVSGSPQGLPRVYLGGVSGKDCWQTIVGTCADLNLSLDLSETDAERMVCDLRTFSQTHAEQAIYPPYIQMLIDHIWRSALGGGRYRYAGYLQAGGMEGITGGYLARQLAYANGQQGLGRAVLVALVRSYGVKAQRSLSEIARDAGISEQTCESLLERLIDLRLVRHVGGDYEVAHDFLAKEISAKLVDSEEREFKRFRELLASKAAAFAVTGGVLTEEELLILFKHKERVLPTDDELKVLVASWVDEAGPALFWLLHAPPERLLELLRVEEADEDLEDEARATLVLLRRMIGKEALDAKDWSLFRRYRLSFQMASLLLSEAENCPESVIRWALRNRQSRVRNAALEVVVRKIQGGNTDWIPSLSKSSSAFLRSAYEELIFRTDVVLPETSMKHRAYRELSVLRRLSRTDNRRETQALQKELNSIRPRLRTQLLARGLALARLHGPRAVVNQAKRVGNYKAFVLLRTLRSHAGSSAVPELLPEYLARNREEARQFQIDNRERRLFYESRANAFALPISTLAAEADVPLLRKALKEIQLTPSAQYLALALLRLGDASDVEFVIRAIAETPAEIRYWLQIEVSHAVEERMQALGTQIPPGIRSVLEEREFWKNPGVSRRDYATVWGLRLKNKSNRTLYIRAVAHAAIGVAQKSDVELLCRLVSHPFSIISRSAAIKLIGLSGETGMQTLQSKISEMIHDGEAENVAEALRAAEIHQYGLARLW
jgi:hypothetical protein